MWHGAFKSGEVVGNPITGRTGERPRGLRPTAARRRVPLPLRLRREQLPHGQSIDGTVHTGAMPMRLPPFAPPRNALVQGPSAWYFCSHRRGAVRGVEAPLFIFIFCWGRFRQLEILMKSRDRRALDFIRIILSFSSSPDFSTKNVRICDKYVII